MGGTVKNGIGDYLEEVNNGDLVSLVLCRFKFIISFAVVVVVIGLLLLLLMMLLLLLLYCCGCMSGRVTFTWIPLTCRQRIDYLAFLSFICEVFLCVCVWDGLIVP